MCKLRLDGGFFLLCTLFLLSSTPPLWLAVLGAILLHEGAHWLLLRDAGARVCALHGSLWGLSLHYDHAERLSYGQELRAVLAGPVANLLAAMLLARCAAMLSWEMGYLLAGVQLLLGAFNSIPVLPFDGGRALYLLTAYRSDPYIADKVLHFTGILFSGLSLLFAVGIFVFRTRSVLLLLAGGCIAAGFLRTHSPRLRR